MSELESNVLPERPLIGRALLFFALLSVEYSVVALRFDGLMHRHAGPWQELTALITFSVLGVSGVLLLRGREVLLALQESLRAQGRLPGLGGPLAVHLLAYAVLLGVAEFTASRVFAPAAFGGLVVALLCAGLVSMTALLRATLSFPSLVLLARRLATPLAFGAAAGVLAFVGGYGASLLWFVLADTTLRLSAYLLTFLGGRVDVVPAEHLLAMNDFVVEVAKECSGIEGMGLIAIFLALYLFSDRARLRFPQAFALFPLGLLAMYVANLLRIVGLVFVGANISPAVALGGFHSKAGWVFFSAVSLSLIYLGSRWSYVTAPVSGRARALGQDPADDGQNDTAVYLMPLLAIVAASLMTSLSTTGSGLDRGYGLRVLCAIACLWFYRRPLSLIPRPISIHASLAGVIAFGLWLWLSPPPAAERSVQMAQALAELHPLERTLWLVMRVIGAVITVPIAEELAFRGFAYRRIIARDFVSQSFQRFSLPALVLSSLAFGFLHSQMLAGSVVGVLYALTMLKRGSLMDAVVAHAVTNGLLSVYVLQTGLYAYW